MGTPSTVNPKRERRPRPGQQPISFAKIVKRESHLTKLSNEIPAFISNSNEHIETHFRLQWMNLAKPTFALGLSGPAGIPRVPDPLGQDEARLHVDADALSYLEPESHFFHDIRTVVAATFEYQHS